VVNAAAASRSSSRTHWEGGALTLITPDGTSSRLQLGYVAGHDQPAVILEGRAIGLLVDETAAASLLNFIHLAAMMDPGGLVRAD
jgi:hypothetical protein